MTAHDILPLAVAVLIAIPALGSCLGVGKDMVAHALPVQRTVCRHEIGAENRRHRVHGLSTGLCACAGDRIGVDHGGASCMQQAGDRSFLS